MSDETDERVILFAGDDAGDDYLPPVWLEHEGTGGEMYLGVGETVGGMVEGVPHVAFEKIRATQLTDPERRVLLAAIEGDHMDPVVLNNAVAKLHRALGDE